MNGERYYVQVTHGYRTMLGGSTKVPPGLEAMVLDRQAAHRCVASFDSQAPEAGSAPSLGKAGALAAAEARAAQLNAEHAAA